MNKNNYVTSYINPDTDGIACSIAMAKFLSTKEERWSSVIYGSIEEETLFLLKELDIPFPDTDSAWNDIDKVVLVDTHHKAQLPTNFPFDKVIAIIDHHPNGDVDAFPYARIINEKIGAAASIVANMYIERDMKDISMLKLLAFAILSNTLNFSAPSTTDYDRKSFQRICDIVTIDTDLVDGMFEQRSLILKKDIYITLCADFKIFETKVGRVGIAQVEAYNIESLIDVSQCICALQRIANENGLEFCIFNGVDIKIRKSFVVAANSQSQRLLCSIFKLTECNSPLIFNRILLRKTDFIPQLNI